MEPGLWVVYYGIEGKKKKGKLVKTIVLLSARLATIVAVFL